MSLHIMAPIVLMVKYAMRAALRTIFSVLLSLNVQILAGLEPKNPQNNYIYMSMHVNDVYSKEDRKPNASNNLG